MLGLKVGASGVKPFWTELLRSLNRRGLRGVKLGISDSHKASRRQLQRCEGHLATMPGALDAQRLAYASRTQRRMASPLGEEVEHQSCECFRLFLGDVMAAVVEHAPFQILHQRFHRFVEVGCQRRRLPSGNRTFIRLAKR